MCRTAIGLKCKDGVVLVRPPASSPSDSNLSLPFDRTASSLHCETKLVARCTRQCTVYRGLKPRGLEPAADCQRVGE